MQQPPDPWQEEQALRHRRLVRLIVMALIAGLLLCSCGALALIPIFAATSQQETPTDHAFQVLFAALFTLLGLLLMFTERQLRQRALGLAPISFVRLLFTSPFGLTFWTGLALFGIALVRLAVPAIASPLNILFWATAGLWLLAEIALNARYLLRPRRARAPGRNID
jgi:hypothetical protein